MGRARWHPKRRASCCDRSYAPSHSDLAVRRSTLSLVRLDHVIADSPVAARDLEVTALAYDNRAVQPGTLFFCVPGFTRDGHEFAPDAIADGAVALVVERPLDLGVPEIRSTTSGPRWRRPPRASTATRRPRSRRSASPARTARRRRRSWSGRCLRPPGGEPGCSAPSRASSAASSTRSSRTTPEAIDLQRTFKEMLDQGDVAAVMEVSSPRPRAPSRRRDPFRRRDLHEPDAGPSRLPSDDGGLLPRQAEAVLRAQTAALDRQHRRPVRRPTRARTRRRRDHVRARRRHRDLPRDEHRHDPHGLDVHGQHPGRRDRAHLAAERAASTSTTSSARSPPRERSTSQQKPPRRRYETAGKVPGRFEAVDEGQDFAVIVDYAHTPDSLENVLNAARGLTDRARHRRLWRRR